MARKAKVTPHLRLRVEPLLLARLEKSAEKNGRTLTGEIVDRLDASFKRDDMQSYVDATAERIAEKVLAAAKTGESKVIIEGKSYTLDLKKLREIYPGERADELAQIVQAALRRHEEEGEQ